MKRIFTKRFFRLDPADQSAVVDSVIHDIEGCIGRHMNPNDDRKAEKQVERIRRKAVEYGVWSAVDGSDRAKPNQKGDLPGQMRLSPGVAERAGGNGIPRPAPLRSHRWWGRAGRGEHRLLSWLVVPGPGSRLATGIVYFRRTEKTFADVI